MSHGRLAELAMLMDGQHKGQDVEWHGVSTDTRTLQPGQLFVALDGPNFRGADFVADAAAAGACAALVQQFVDLDLPQFAVPDTRHALGVIAADWRTHFHAPLIGVTGSNGKTTVKQLLAALFGPDAFATHGNLNNEIGVPLSLLALTSEHSAAVIEMGANHIGEIAYLASLGRPDIGVVTNAGPAHLEGFGSLDGVAHGKGEMFYALGAAATAIINRDDVYYSLWVDLADPARVVTFGVDAAADIRAEAIATHAGGTSFELVGPDFRHAVELPLPGKHNVLNACAAFAAAFAAGIEPAVLAARLSDVVPPPSRLRECDRADGGVLIDDSYNANPASMRVAAESALAHGCPVWMALGDMGELGPQAASIHAELGADFKALGVAHLATVGPLMAECAKAFGPDAATFADHDAMIRHLRATLTPDVVLIVKGSRAARMELIVDALVSDRAEVAHA